MAGTYREHKKNKAPTAGSKRKSSFHSTFLGLTSRAEHSTVMSTVTSFSSMVDEDMVGVEPLTGS